MPAEVTPNRKNEADGNSVHLSNLGRQKRLADSGGMQSDKDTTDAYSMTTDDTPGRSQEARPAMKRMQNKVRKHFP